MSKVKQLMAEMAHESDDEPETERIEKIKRADRRVKAAKTRLFSFANWPRFSPGELVTVNMLTGRIVEVSAEKIVISYRIELDAMEGSTTKTIYNATRLPADRMASLIADRLSGRYKMHDLIASHQITEAGYCMLFYAWGKPQLDWLRKNHSRGIDWLVRQSGRDRHNILKKASSLGLKLEEPGHDCPPSKPFAMPIEEGKAALPGIVPEDNQVVDAEFWSTQNLAEIPTEPTMAVSIRTVRQIHLTICWLKHRLKITMPELDEIEQAIDRAMSA